MNSLERHEARYQRRKARRIAKHKARCEALGGIETVFRYDNLFQAGHKCCNGVRWKQSTQNFEAHLFSKTATLKKRIAEGAWEPSKGTHFVLRERGKIRPIDAPRIIDRQLHKALTKECLLPLYQPSLIYDNGASLKGKGLHFHFRRLKEHLRWYYKRYGRRGGVLLIDFKKFFPTASHEALCARHARYILDAPLCEIADKIVDAVPGNIGMELGVEASQAEMVALPSSVDNWLKCQLGIHCVGHYMDDYYIILPDIDALKRLKQLFIQKAKAIGLTVHPDKSRIISLDKPFKFCKAKFTLTDSGKIIMHGNRDSVKRLRRKIRTFRRKVSNNEMTFLDAKFSFDCSIAYFQNYNDHNRELKLNRYFHSMFKEEMKNVAQK